MRVRRCSRFRDSYKREIFFRLVSIGVLFLSVLAGACAGDPSVKAAQYAASGDAYAAQRRFKEAAIQYANASEWRPDWAEPPYKRAQALLAAGDRGRARKAFERAASLDRTNADASLNAGRLALAAGDREAAAAHGQLALEADPQLVAAHILVGSALASLGDTRAARQRLERAVALAPSSAAAWTALGAAAFVAAEYSAAADAFAKAVGLTPQSADVRVALAAFQSARGDTRGAEATLRDAVALDGSHAAANRALAVLYITSGNAAAAEPYLQQVAHDNPGRLALADYYLQTNRPSDALAPLRDVIGSGTRREIRDATFRVALAEYGSNPVPDQRDRFERTLRARVEAEPDDLDACQWLARLYVGEDRLDAAIDQYQTLANRSKAPAGAWTMIGLLQAARRNPAAARAAYERALAHDPHAAVAANNLAWMLAEAGELDEALRLALIAQDRFGPRPQAHDTVGWIYLKKAWTARAVDAFTRAVAAAPNNSLYTDHLRLARSQAGKEVHR